MSLNYKSGLLFAGTADRQLLEKSQKMGREEAKIFSTHAKSLIYDPLRPSYREKKRLVSGGGGKKGRGKKILFSLASGPRPKN